MPRVQACKPWPRLNFFYVLWIELRFCMRKAITSVAGGKILLAKTNWFFHEKSSTFQNFRLHMLHLSCHSTCPLSLRVLLSKRQSRLYESLQELHVGGDSRQRNEFVDFGAQTSRKSQFFTKFHHLTRATGASMQTLASLELFLCPMDRADVLHAPSYNISDRRKNTTSENELVLP